MAMSELAVISNSFSIDVERSETARKAHGIYAMLASATEDVDEPKSFQQAMNCDEKGRWIQAMREEYQSLQANKTWELCEGN